MTNLNLHLPSYDEILQKYQTVPAYSLLLGMGDDNIPLMLDLTEPGAGSFLVVGDVEKVTQQILNSMLTSACQQNTQYELSVHLITRSDRHYRLQKSPQVRNVFSPADPASEVLIEEMCQLLDKRQDDRIQLPVQLLAIDKITELLAVVSPKTKRLLLRLIKHGPFWGIWVIGTMTTLQLDEPYYEVIESFPSRVLGRIEDKGFARYFTGLPLANLRGLTPVEALVRVGEDIFSVWIPESESDRN